MKKWHKQSVVLASLAAGLADTATGLGLILLPFLTLGYMGVQVGNDVIPFIRFIGAFVMATGSLYLWGVFIVRKVGKWDSLRTIWLVTAWIRIVVACVTSYLLLSGQLQFSWVSVPATDATFAVIQLLWLRYWSFPENE